MNLTCAFDLKVTRFIQFFDEVDALPGKRYVGKHVRDRHASAEPIATIAVAATGHFIAGVEITLSGDGVHKAREGFAPTTHDSQCEASTRCNEQ